MTRKRMPKIVYEPTIFTPREVAKITGLTTGMQRDWRSRGYLPKSDKHARFGAPEVAKLMVMQMLADRTIGPLESRAIAAQCAAAIVSHAMVWVDGAWAGEPEKIFDAIDPEARGPTRWDKWHEEGKQLTREHLAGEAKFGKLLEDILPYSPDQKTEFASNRRREVESLMKPHAHYDNEKREWFLDQLGPGARDDWYLKDGASEIIWWPTGEVTIGSWQGIRESVREDDPRFDGAAVVLPVDGLALQLVRRAGKPLLGVRLEERT